MNWSNWQLYLAGLLVAVLSWWMVNEHALILDIQLRQNLVRERLATLESQILTCQDNGRAMRETQQRYEEKLDAVFRELLRHDSGPRR